MSDEGTAPPWGKHMLLFKKKFHEAIRSGRKRQTIRLWKHAHMRAGQITYIPGLGRARIVSIEPIRLEEITDQDAILDGFASRGQLIEELGRLYADRIAAGYQCFKIRFDWPIDGGGDAASSPPPGGAAPRG